MKAVVIDRYGNPTVLQLKEVNKLRLAADSANLIAPIECGAGINTLVRMPNALLL